MLKQMEEVVDSYKNQIKDDGNFYFYDKLPEKKLNNALATYLVLEPNEKCLVFVDDTFFGSGKEGIVITNLAIYTKDVATEPMRFSFLEIQEAKKSGLLIDDISIDGVKIKDFTQTSKKSIKLLTELINDLIKVVKQENQKLVQEKNNKFSHEIKEVIEETKNTQTQRKIKKRKIDNSLGVINKYKVFNLSDNSVFDKSKEAYKQNYYNSVHQCLFIDAEKGDIDSQYELGIIYAKGDGVEQDDTLSFSWFEKAAKQGYSEAQYILGLMYSNGKGVEQDNELALKWFEKSAKQGHTDALNIINSVYKL